MKFCPKCNKSHNNLGLFCSRSCANSRGPRTEEFKLKVRSKLKGKISKNKGKQLVKRIEVKCFICNSIILKTEKDIARSNNKFVCNSQECKKESCRYSGKMSALKRKHRSKDEIILYNLCKSVFSDVKSNEVISDGWDADIVLPKYKIAVLWNGPWHYKEMNMSNHSLKQVQNRDNIKINLFESLGWKVYVFEDRYYTPLQAFQKLVGDPRVALS